MNNKPYIDPSLFTKPPPNFKNNQSQWNSFKIPLPPATSSNNMKSPIRYSINEHTTSKRYSYPSRHSNSIRDYKNGPPPNYQHQKLDSQISSKNYKNDLVYNPVSLIQSFKPSVPPPPYNKSGQYNVNVEPNLTSTGISPQSMLYRCYNGQTSSSLPLSQMSYTQTPTNSYAVHPPPNHYSISQPPLPTGPPPQNPPLPPPPPGSSSGTTMSMQNHPMSNHMNNYHRVSAYPGYDQYNNNFKRKFEGSDSHKKLQKKKKKPLSQVVPQRKDWTLEEAKKALNVEKDSNKRFKRQGLIIKFPDLELNRDIVSNLHTSIESVHFQQPSTPRYCFVTLRESADPETVIKQLNQIPFGLGYLSAECKKDREDEQNISATDIDPLTLYVGNLAQEITKEDMTKTYPKQKRIDIGYAKKMKYTRYAFVSFHTVDDAIEAFQRTHSSQMYSKSLIVRFRRLHGTVGMPGESKQPVNPRSEIDFTSDSGNNSIGETSKSPNPWDIDISHWEHEYPDLKQQSDNEEDDDEMDIKPSTSAANLKTNIIPPTFKIPSPIHKPDIITIKKEKDDEVIEVNDHSHKTEKACEVEEEVHATDIKQEKIPFTNIKQETNGIPPRPTSYRCIQISSSLTKSPNVTIESAVSIKKEKDDDQSSSEKSGSDYSLNETCSSDTHNQVVIRNDSPSDRSDSCLPSNEQENSQSSNVQIECNTQSSNDNENNSEEREYGEANFNWMNMSCSNEVIKTESDDEMDDGDDDSSEDELSIDNLLKRARNRSKRSYIQ